MTLLGYRNPLRRASHAVRGLFRRPAAPTAERRVFVIGHRGAPHVAPENTVESFDKAIGLGADGVEADVCVTRDGRFVLWHDSRPSDKAAIFRGLGQKKYLSQAEGPDLGSPLRRPVNELDFDDFMAHHGYVPRKKKTGDPVVPPAVLEDLFDWASRERRVRLVCLDVKLDEKEGPAGHALARFVADCRRSGRLRAGLLVAMFCPQREILQAMLTEERRDPLGPDIHVFADFEFPGALDFAKHYGADSVSLGVARRLWPDLRDELGEVLAAREAGRIESVIVWTVSEKKRLSELAGMRVDGILTDDPALLRRIVGE